MEKFVYCITKSCWFAWILSMNFLGQIFFITCNRKKQRPIPTWHLVFQVMSLTLAYLVLYNLIRCHSKVPVRNCDIMNQTAWSLFSYNISLRLLLDEWSIPLRELPYTQRVATIKLKLLGHFYGRFCLKYIYTKCRKWINFLWQPPPPQSNVN